MKFKGLYTAIITPFKDNQVDVEAFRNLVEMQIAAGVDGIVAVGTTGESPTLSHEEHMEVIRLAIEFSNKRCQVIAGTGSNATDEAIIMTQEAARMGADGSLQVCPYYNKPSNEGLYQHFKAIAKSCDMPIMLYNVPGRSGIEIPVETVARLAADCPNIVSIKEAGGKIERIDQIRALVHEDFSILSGDDALTVPFISCGAHGLVSVTSNIAPAQMKQLVDAAILGDGKRASALQKKYYPLMTGLMTLENNPCPIKAAHALAGDCGWEIRLPLVPLAASKREQLSELLTQFDLI